MKNSIWDVLTGITLLGILCLIAGFGAVLLNPGLVSGLLPIATPQSAGAEVELIPTIALPTDTEVPDQLPPTWTPTPNQVNQPVEDVRPTLRPSSTPLPTNTPVVLPTFTPTKKSSTGGSAGGVGGGSCSVVYQNPVDDATMTAGQDFTTRWTLKNNSSTTWRADTIDVIIAGGDRMHIGPDARDLPYDVGTNGGMVDILIDMQAPDRSGTFSEYWSLMSGSSQICQFFVTIKVR